MKVVPSMDRVQSGCPWTPGPCFVLTRINVPPHTNAQMLLYPHHFKHQFISRTNVERKIFGRVSGSSVRSFRSAFPAPPLLTSTWKMSDLGWPKSWFLLGVPWSRCRYMMANQVIRALFVYSLALFYGFMVCFFLLLSAIRNLEIPRRGKRREKRK